MIPPEFNTIVNQLKHRFGGRDGIQLFNWIRSFCGYFPQTVAGVAEGIRTLPVRFGAEYAVSCLANIQRIPVYRTLFNPQTKGIHLVGPILHQYCIIAAQKPETISLPRFPVKTVYEEKRINPHDLNTELNLDLKDYFENIRPESICDAFLIMTDQLLRYIPDGPERTVSIRNSHHGLCYPNRA